MAPTACRKSPLRITAVPKVPQPKKKLSPPPNLFKIATKKQQQLKKGVNKTNIRRKLLQKNLMKKLKKATPCCRRVHFDPYKVPVVPKKPVTEFEVNCDYLRPKKTLAELMAIREEERRVLGLDMLGRNLDDGTVSDKYIMI